MSYVLVTDSSANLTDELIEQLDVRIVSLLFRVDGQVYHSYEPGKKTDLGKFYAMMRERKEITTSLVDYKDCVEEFEKALSAGKDVLYIGFSSGLSGTYQAACLAAADLQEKYPQQKIITVDSLAASLGQGLLVYYAAKLRLQGAELETVAEWVEAEKLSLCHWFTVDDLFFLKRGGRVSAAVAIAGTALRIKPVMHVDNAGKLIPVSKVQGRKKSLDALVQKMEETAICPEEQMVFISHGDCEEDALYVKQQLQEKLKVPEVVINYVDPVVGAHSGPGTVALFFLGAHR